MSILFKTKAQEWAFLATSLLAFLVFYIETDIYTPSFPQMLQYFNETEEQIQMILSMNFLGLCLSSLFFGPASDAFGRKKILFVGLLMFMLGSLGCAFSDELTWMIRYRFLQGVGCGSIVSAGLAVFFDVYPPQQSARLVSILNGTVGGVMALAPMVGNWINLQWGWRANFYLIAVLAVLTFLANIFLTKESLAPEKRTAFNLKAIVHNYYSLLMNFPFMAYNFIWCLSFSVIIVFIANLSLIFIDYLQVPIEKFGFYQTAIMGAFFVGSMGAAYTIKKMGVTTTKIMGSLLFIFSVVWLALLSYLDIHSPILLIAAMSLASLGAALSLTIYFTLSMNYITDTLKGSAMALTQSLRLVLSSGLVWLAAQSFDGTTKPLSMIALISATVCSMLYIVLSNRRMLPIQS